MKTTKLSVRGSFFNLEQPLSPGRSETDKVSGIDSIVGTLTPVELPRRYQVEGRFIQTDLKEFITRDLDSPGRLGSVRLFVVL